MIRAIPRSGILADIVSAQLRATQSTPSSSGPLNFTILLVPRATELCRKVLEDEGVAGDVTISEVGLTVPKEQRLQLKFAVQAGIRTSGG